MAPKKYIYGVEIARLVLGYLLKANKKLFKEFLDTSPFFYDIRDAYDEGDEIDLNYRDKSLQDILEEYAHLSRILHCKILTLVASEQVELSGRPLPEKLDVLLRASPTPNFAVAKAPDGCRCFRPRASAASQTVPGLEKGRPDSQKNSNDASTVTTSTQTEWTSPPFHDMNMTGTNSMSSPLPDVPTTPGTGLFMPRDYYLERNNSSKEITSSDSASARQDCLEHMEVDDAGTGASVDVPGKLSRSRSCGDLPTAENCSEMKEVRRKFFTPNKWRNEEPTDEFLEELLANRSIHEKLARSINHALADVPEECQMDDFVQSIIEKTTADPTFDEIVNETLGSFDMTQFLRPKPPRDSMSCDNNQQAEESLMPVQQTANAVLSATLVSMPVQTAEMIPYPNISYQPVDRNIYISDLDEKGDVVFYSNPNCHTEGVFLPPPPPAVTKPTTRYRRIQPKPEAVKDPAINVVVCTPLMPQSVPEVTEMPSPLPHTVSKRRRSKPAPNTVTRGTRTTRATPQPFQTPVHEAQEEVAPMLLIPATPGRVYTDDMPFLSTPQQPRDPPSETASPKCVRPQTPVVGQPETTQEPVRETKDPTPKDTTLPNHVPEITPHQTQPRKRQTQSTPRRKSYIRTLEFETPQKDADAKKCVTVPKRDPPMSERTPEEMQKSAQVEKVADKAIGGKVTGKKEKLRKKELILDVGCSKPLPAKKGGKLPRSAIKIGLSPRNKSRLEQTKPTPIATRTPNKTLLSGFWDPLKTVIGESTPEPLANTVDTSEIASLSSTATNVEPNAVQTWDSILRNCVGGPVETEKAPRTVRRRRKIRPKNSPKKRKITEPRASKPRVTRSKTAKMSPSKKHAKSTTKRSTYAISHGSSSAFETSSSDEGAFIEVCVKKPDNSEITPAKIDMPVQPTEETPFTKLLRENVDCVDIDISMIQTPVFPPTPSIGFFQDPVTPLHETRRTDYSSGSSYYKPDLTSPVSGKETVAMETVAEMEKSEEFLQDVSTVSGRNLVLTPDEKESSPTKQNKITDYFGKYPRVDLSPEKMPTVPVAPCLQLSSDESVVSDQSTVVDLRTTTDQNQTSEEPKEPMTNAVDIDTVEPIDKTPEPLEAPESSKKTAKEKTDTVRKATPSVEKLAKSVTKPRVPGNETKINQIVVEGRKMVARRKIGGKHMGMFKLQMIAQCDVKLSENIPIFASPLKPVSEVDKAQEANDVSSQQRAETVPHNDTVEPSRSEPVVSQLRDLWKRKSGAEDMRSKPSMSSNPVSEVAGDIIQEESHLSSQQSAETVPQNDTAEPSRSEPVLSQLRDLWKRKSAAEDTRTKPSVLEIAKKLETGAKSQSSNVLEELEVKRRETIQKLKAGEAVKRSRKPLDRPTKRVRVAPKKVEVLPVPLVSSTPTKSDSSRISLSVSDADETLKPESPIVSCPSRRGVERVVAPDSPKKATSIGLVPKSPEKCLETRDKKSPGGFLPTFVDNGEFPELSLNTKKKLFAINFLLERQEVRSYLNNTTNKVRLHSAHRAIFRAMFKWLKNPRDGEVSCPKVQERMKHYLTQFSRVNDGLPAKNDRSFDASQEECNSGGSGSRRNSKSPGRQKNPSLLPLKKRKNNVHISKAKDEAKPKSSGESGKPVSNDAVSLVSTTAQQPTHEDRLPVPGPVTNPRTLLQEIDVDRFLSRVHGHDSS